MPAPGEEEPARVWSLSPKTESFPSLMRGGDEPIWLHTHPTEVGPPQPTEQFARRKPKTGHFTLRGSVYRIPPVETFLQEKLGDTFDSLIDDQSNYPQLQNAFGPVGMHVRHLRGVLRAYLNGAGTIAEVQSWERGLAAQQAFTCDGLGIPLEDCRKRLHILFPELRAFLNDFLRKQLETNGALVVKNP